MHEQIESLFHWLQDNTLLSALNLPINNLIFISSAVLIVTILYYLTKTAKEKNRLHLNWYNEQCERKQLQDELSSREQYWNQLKDNWSAERQQFQQTLNEWNQLQVQWDIERDSLNQALNAQFQQSNAELRAWDTERQHLQQSLNDREQVWKQLQQNWDIERAELAQNLANRIFLWQTEQGKHEQLEQIQLSLTHQILAGNAEREALKRDMARCLSAWQAEISERERLEKSLQRPEQEWHVERSELQEEENYQVQELNQEQEPSAQSQDSEGESSSEILNTEAESLPQVQDAAEGEPLLPMENEAVEAGVHVDIQRNQATLQIRLGLHEIALTKTIGGLNENWINTVNMAMTDRLRNTCDQVFGNDLSPEYFSQLMKVYPHVFIEHILFKLVEGIKEDPNKYLKALLSHAIGMNEADVSRSHISAIKTGINRVAQYPRSIFRKLNILAAEERIKRRISESGIPFLGLIGSEMTVRERRAVQSAIPNRLTLNDFIRALQNNPALLSTHITTEIMTGMGQDVVNDVWPHVARAMGMCEIPVVDDRQSIWQAFRTAIEGLGLEVSLQVNGHNYMVNEFLRQVGIPWAYLPDFVKILKECADEQNLPNEEDNQAIMQWQHNLIGYTNIQAIQRALILDTQGYYTRTYINIQQHGLPDNPTPLAQALYAALQTLAQQVVIPRNETPYIAFDGRSIGVMIPGGNGLTYHISVDGDAIRYHATEQARLYVIEADLPHSIRIEYRESENRIINIGLWPNRLDNHLLVFTSKGRYVESATLSQQEVVELPAGHYQVLSRFNPANIDGVQALGIFYFFGLDLAANTDQVITRAGTAATITIQSESRPTLAVADNNNRTMTLERKEVFWGNLSLQAYIPEEYRSNDYCLKISSEVHQQTIEIPVHVDIENGTVNHTIAANAWSESFGIGLYRLKIRLVKTAENRVIATESLLYWIGLDDITPDLRFVCNALPDNLNEAHIQHVGIDPDHHWLEPLNMQAQQIQLAFDCGRNQPRILSWRLPNFFFIQKKYIQNGQESITLLKLGKQIAVSELDRTRYAITSSQSGCFKFGEWQEKFNPDQRGTRVFPSSFLASLSENYPGVESLSFEVNGLDIPLLRILTTPLVAQSMTKVCSEKNLKLTFSMNNRLTGLTATAIEMQTGQSFDFTITVTHKVGQNFEYGTAWLTQIENEPARLSIDFNQKLPEGAWFLRFDGQIGENIGSIQNANKKIYAVGFHWCDGRITDTHHFLELDDTQSLEVLKRTNSALLQNYTQVSWNTVKWIEQLWGRQVDRWQTRIPEALHALVDIASEIKPDAISIRTICGMMPSLFTLPSAQYQGFNKNLPPLFSVLTLMGQRPNAEHYQSAINKLIENYRNRIDPYNIRGETLLFCRNARHFIPNMPIPAQYDNLPFEFNLGSGEIDQVTREGLANFSHVLALLACYCRLESRQCGTLTDFLHTIRRKEFHQNQNRETHLSYLLQTGESLFAYYLLLWEFVLTAENNP